MTYDKRELQPGSYHGEADVFVLRDVLQLSGTKEEAVSYIQAANRTWGMWVGIGDYASQQFNLVAYSQKSAEVYDDKTMPAQTGQPYFESLVYVDKHPQPTHDGATGSLPTVLGDLYGSISIENTKIVTQFHETGDLHIASYDFTAKQMNVAIGRINKDGKYGPDGGDEWKAYNRPYLKFDLTDLWDGL